MRKICVFTQTYSDDREELFVYHNKDHTDISFRNLFDLSLYSFHRTTNGYTNRILDFPYFKNLNNLRVVEYDDSSYTNTLKKTLELLKSEDFTHIIFLEDDCFTLNYYTQPVINFIKGGEYDLLNIEYHIDVLKIENCPIYYEEDKFCVYDTQSTHYSNVNMFAFDNSPFAANIDFLLNSLYDETFFGINDLWVGENYLNNKIKSNKIKRYITNNPIYKRYNITGRNAWNRSNEIKNLETKLV